MKTSEKNWFVILMVIVFFPVGLYLMWKQKKFTRIVRIGITAFIAAIVILSPLSKTEIIEVPKKEPEEVVKEEPKKEEPKKEEPEEVIIEEPEVEEEEILDYKNSSDSYIKEKISKAISSYKVNSIEFSRESKFKKGDIKIVINMSRNTNKSTQMSDALTKAASIINILDEEFWSVIEDYRIAFVGSINGGRKETLFEFEINEYYVDKIVGRKSISIDDIKKNSEYYFLHKYYQ